ncbi:MAG: 4-diphosphocytidyl-2-C-methyl-D-erythritol kinase, partial [Thermoleophilaceae bacterium]|nr:4-diphosphocytidyl-2-C-methyl-D-erythritol kinase [Thermoleophilaceae bacterium]
MIELRAPAKVNLVLHVGPVRGDGLHELCSLFASLELADEVRVERAARGAAGDSVTCPGVGGPNLAARALAELRAELGGELPPLAVTIDKRIPVAAGLGGGSADAAAVLRAANELAGRPLGANALRAIGARLGADVPSQVEPGHALVTGAGEGVERLALPPLALVLVPQHEGLSTPAVYREADRIGSTRERLDPDALRALAAAPVATLAAALDNDLEPAALSLRPELRDELDGLRAAGALAARITGSGPTAFGVFATRAAAERAAA